MRIIAEAPFDRRRKSVKSKTGRHPRICRWCGTIVVRPRRSWCSQECVDEYLIRRTPSYARRKVRYRDRGICSICGTDTYLVKREALKMPRPVRKTWLVDHGFDPCRSTLWDMDHILPVSEGGGVCGLGNLRTVCSPCHKTETVRLTARLAVRRKEVKMLNSLFDSNSPEYPVGPEGADTYIIIDCMNVMHKAHHVFNTTKGLSTSRGLPSGHVYGILKMVTNAFRLFKKGRTCLVFALEGPRQEQKKRGFGGYKDNRKPEDEVFEDFNPLPDQHRALECFSGLFLQVDGGEADDAIYHFAKQHQDSRIYIHSSDQDTWALVDETTTVVSSGKEITVDDVRKKFGVGPEKIQLFKAVFGDSSDNIPRAVPRVRTKILLEIVRRSDCIAEVLRGLRGIGQPKEVLFRALLNYYLVVPVGGTEMSQTWHIPEVGFVKDYMLAWEIKSLIDLVVGWAQASETDPYGA